MKKMTDNVGHGVLDLVHIFISTSERSHCVPSSTALYYYRSLSVLFKKSWILIELVESLLFLMLTLTKYDHETI